MMRPSPPTFLPLPRRAPRRSGPPPLPSRALLVVPQTSAAPSPAAVTRAVEASDGGPVTVLTVLRIHGSGLGIPHPGLLPNAEERERGRQAVAAAISALEAKKVKARGEIAVTRADARAIARTARAIGADTVILDLPVAHGLRRLIEGDLSAQLRRRLRGDAVVA